MQKDLENLAREMQKLKSDERLYWLQSMAQCRESLHPTTYPTYKTYNQIVTDFRRFKNTLIWSLSGILIGKNEETPVVKNGVDAFMSLSKDERDAFYRSVLGKEEPQKIATKDSSKTGMTRQNKGHERH